MRRNPGKHAAPRTGARATSVARAAVPAGAALALIVTMSSSVGASGATADGMSATASTALAAALADRTSAADALSVSTVDARAEAADLTRERSEQRAQRAAADRQAIAERKAKAKAKAKKKAAAIAAAHRWVAPVKQPNLTSSFGFRWGRLHAGLDFGAVVGTPLHAMSTGTVTKAGWGGGYGMKVEITYWDGTVSYFAHMSQIEVAQGEKVTPGQVVGKSGNTGNSTGPHLHLEIHPGGGEAVDPKPWFTKRGLKF